MKPNCRIVGNGRISWRNTRSMEGRPGIRETFRDQNVLVTGATGFMGKVLVEKLLRSCSELDKIYLIVRGRKGVSPEERWRKCTDVMLFDRLKREKPGLLESKVVVLDGDVSELRLGLNEEDYARLQQEVNIIFHAAANVRFNDPFKSAVLLNLRGTREVVLLAKDAPNFKILVHVSTTFSYCCQTKCEEVINPSPMNWKDAIRIAENLDTEETTILQQKFLGGYPNTYTFTKNLAEALVADHVNIVPSVVVRPSVVTPSSEDPIPGWVDNLNGPMGIVFGGGVGVLRKAPIDPKALTDYVPVDVAVQAIIASAWYHLTYQRNSSEIPVYNLTDFEAGFDNISFIHIGKKLPPFKDIIWRPAVNNFFTKRSYVYTFYSIFVHLLIAVLIDKILQLLQKKPMNLVKIQTRIHVAMTALNPFMNTRWEFSNNNYRQLQREILPQDQDCFGAKTIGQDMLAISEHGRDLLIVNLLNKDYLSIKKKHDEEAYRKHTRLFWVEVIVQSCLALLAIRMTVNWLLEGQQCACLLGLEHDSIY